MKAFAFERKEECFTAQRHDDAIGILSVMPGHFRRTGTILPEPHLPTLKGHGGTTAFAVIRMVNAFEAIPLAPGQHKQR